MAAYSKELLMNTLCAKCPSHCCWIPCWVEPEEAERLGPEYTEGTWMKRREDGSCVALNRETSRCTIYEDRPEKCREFEIDGYLCRKLRGVASHGIVSQIIQPKITVVEVVTGFVEGSFSNAVATFSSTAESGDIVVVMGVNTGNNGVPEVYENSVDVTDSALGAQNNRAGCANVGYSTSVNGSGTLEVRFGPSTPTNLTNYVVGYLLRGVDDTAIEMDGDTGGNGSTTSPFGSGDLTTFEAGDFVSAMFHHSTNYDYSSPATTPDIDWTGSVSSPSQTIIISDDTTKTHYGSNLHPVDGLGIATGTVSPVFDFSGAATFWSGVSIRIGRDTS